MGFLQTFWKWTKKSISWIFRGIGEVVAAGVQTLTTELKVIDYKLKKWMVDEIGPGWTWVITVGIQAAVGLLLPVIGRQIKLFLESDVIKDMNKKITDSFDPRVLQFAFGFYKLSHEGLLAVSDAYREGFLKLSSALNGLGDYVGAGRGFLMSYLQTSQQTYSIIMAMLGMQPREDDLLFYDEVGKWFAKASGDVEKYIRHPESLYQDLYTTLIRPQLDAMIESGKYQNEKLLEIGVQIGDVWVQFDDLVTQMDATYSMLYKDFEEELILPFRAFRETINNLTADYVLPVLDELKRFQIELQEKLENDKESESLKQKSQFLLFNVRSLALLKQENYQKYKKIIDYSALQPGIEFVNANIKSAMRRMPYYG